MRKARNKNKFFQMDGDRNIIERGPRRSPLEKKADKLNAEKGVTDYFVFGIIDDPDKLSNSEQFYIVDSNLKIIARGKDFDRLQERVDRDFFDDENQKFVISKTDYDEAKRVGQKNPFDYFNKDKLDELSLEFQGKKDNSKFDVLSADGTPRKLARLGFLKQLKIRDLDGKEYEVNFDYEDDAWLAADARRNLYFVGEDAVIENAILPEEIGYFGQLIQVDYITEKEHIGDGETIRFYHEVGEVDSNLPTVLIDKEGFLLLYGGNYDITRDGIVN